MATYRGQTSLYNIGEAPPFVNWTFVKGDTAAFKVYLTDDAKVPLNIPDWNISMQIKRRQHKMQMMRLESLLFLLQQLKLKHFVQMIFLILRFLFQEIR
jgi:hypothetical protein